MKKKCLDEKLVYITNKLKIILFNQFYSFFENINNKFVFDFVIEELIIKKINIIINKNFFEKRKLNQKIFL